MYGAAVLTFAVLLSDRLYSGDGHPRIPPSLFQWNYTSESVLDDASPSSLMVETTALALLLAVPPSACSLASVYLKSSMPSAETSW